MSKKFKEAAQKHENDTNKATTAETVSTEENASSNKKKDNKKNSKVRNNDSKVENKDSKTKNNKEIETLKEQIAKEKEDYLRLMAEFENFRRRKAEERIELISTAASSTIEGLLPILDDCERAIEMLNNSDDSEAAKEGTTLIYEKLLKYLESKGLKEIEAKGTQFDTDFHEAVTQFPISEGQKKGEVIDVVQTGYTLNGKVLRYAKVVVGV